MRLKLMTTSLPRRRSTPELRGPDSQRSPKTGAGDEIRTRDPQLGRLMLYQLSYTRPRNFELRNANCEFQNNLSDKFGNSKSEIRTSTGAGGRIRTYVGREPAGFTARCH